MAALLAVDDAGRAALRPDDDPAEDPGTAQRVDSVSLQPTQTVGGLVNSPFF